MIDPPNTKHVRRQKELGFFYGLLAYLWWGLIPIYFKLVASVPPLLLMSHRVVWSFTLLVIVGSILVPWRELWNPFRDRRVLRMLALSTVFLATNWGMFIWAVSSGRVMQASLGYFINPLVSVALAVTLLKERLRIGQCVGLALALIGVIVLTIVRGHVPWIALSIAFSFAGYGLMRKLTHIGPLVGLTVETALLLPLAIVYIAMHRDAEAHISRSTYELVLLSGVVTAVPLLSFAAAIRRLKFSTMGFMQYVVPTCQFLLAIFAYHEHFDRGNFVGFACIWIALIIYSLDSLNAFRTAGDAVEEPPLAAEIS